MSNEEDPKKIGPSDGPKPREKEKGTGEGAETALRALIRKRKQVETPDDPGNLPPAAAMP
jgi:hypothetical protein